KTKRGEYFKQYNDLRRKRQAPMAAASGPTAKSQKQYQREYRWRKAGAVASTDQEPTSTSRLIVHGARSADHQHKDNSIELHYCSTEGQQLASISPNTMCAAPSGDQHCNHVNAELTDVDLAPSRSLPEQPANGGDCTVSSHDELPDGNRQATNLDDIDEWCDRILHLATETSLNVSDTNDQVQHDSDTSAVGDEYAVSDVEVYEFATAAMDTDKPEIDAVPPSLTLPLFEGSRHSLGSAVLRVQECVVKHHLPTTAVESVLDMLHDLLPSDNIMPNTRYLFDKTIGGQLSATCSIYCLNCSSEVQSRSEGECSYCKTLLKNNTGCFWLIDPREQLQCAIEGRGLLSKVTFPADQKVEGNVLHWSTSQAYTKFKNRINVSQRADLTYTVGVDGFPLYRTSPCELCPVYISINELPERLKPTFIITCGLWSGKKALRSAAFMPTVVKSLNSLQTDGVFASLCTGNDVSTCTIRFHPLMAVMDAPQRAETLGLCRFNSINGCDKCYIQSQSVKVKAGYARKFTMAQAQLSMRLAIDKGCSHMDRRTKDDSIMLHETKGAKAANNLGVKAVSPLVNLSNFDYIEDSPPCYLHQVCLGQMRWLLAQLFNARGNKPDPNASACPDLHSKVAEVDKAIRRIFVPDSVQRSPRSLSEMGYFRGHEYETWMLIIAPMVMEEFLVDHKDHYYHLLLLASAMFWLTWEGAPMSQIQLCQKSLTTFGRLLEHLYSASALTYNAHMVSEHMVPTAQRFGPLRMASAGIFEANHFRLKSSLHGKRLADVEVCRILRQRVGCIRLASSLHRDSVLHERQGATSCNIGQCHLKRFKDGLVKSVTTAHGHLLTPYRSRPTSEGARVSSFVAVLSRQQDNQDSSDEQDCQLTFARIETIAAQENEILLRLRLVLTAVTPRSRQAMRLLSGRADGCSCVHFAKLECDAFGDLPFLAEISPDAVIGTCAVSDTHIAVLPTVQGWHAP
ncbi:hypothetical protein BOX15_Mlig026393g2, partial [Macrostomum lignano]